MTGQIPRLRFSWARRKCHTIALSRCGYYPISLLSLCSSYVLSTLFGGSDAHLTSQR
jgi:hypothetical protein